MDPQFQILVWGKYIVCNICINVPCSWKLGCVSEGVAAETKQTILCVCENVCRFLEGDAM